MYLNIRYSCFNDKNLTIYTYMHTYTHIHKYIGMSKGNLKLVKF